jgi:hypothetical protein
MTATYETGRTVSIDLSEIRQIRIEKFTNLETASPYLETFWWVYLDDEKHKSWVLNDHFPHGLLFAIRLKHHLPRIRLARYLWVKFGPGARERTCYVASEANRLGDPYRG